MTGRRQSQEENVADAHEHREELRRDCRHHAPNPFDENVLQRPHEVPQLIQCVDHQSGSKGNVDKREANADHQAAR